MRNEERFALGLALRILGEGNRKVDFMQENRIGEDSPYSYGFSERRRVCQWRRSEAKGLRHGRQNMMLPKLFSSMSAISIAEYRALWYQTANTEWLKSRGLAPEADPHCSLGVLMTLMECEMPVAAVSKTASGNSSAYWVYKLHY